MGAFEYIFIYVVSWWIVLFMVLPFKAKTVENPEVTEYHAAPVHPYLKEKCIVTTILAFFVTIILSYLISSGIITLWLPYKF